MQKDVYQYNNAGHFSGVTQADESPLEAGVWLMPARTVEIAPPESWPTDKWPRWDGAAWQLGAKPAPKPDPNDPVEKLQAFLQSNPDVAALLNSNQGGV